jgi:phenylacetate-CoA ligase
MEHLSHHMSGLGSILKHESMSVPEDVFDTLRNHDRAYRLWNRFKAGLLQNPYRSREEMEQWRLKRLRRLVDHAFRHVPFYRELYGKSGYEAGGIRSIADLTALPITNKDMLISAGDGVLATDRRREIYVSRTSGSTGKTFSVHYNRNNAIWYSLATYRQFSIMLGRPLKEKDWLYVVHFIRGWLSSLNGKYKTFVLSRIEDRGEFVQHLKRLSPAVLWTMPGYLRDLEQGCVSLAKTGVELIVTNSESSTREERIRFEEVFGVKVRDEYSSEELGIIASECEQRHYHVNSDSVHLEFLAAGDREYEMLGTDLWNFAAPFIRFNHGDLASAPIDSQCACGQASVHFSRLYGRRDSCLVRSDGSLINSSVVTNLGDHFLVDESLIREFRLLQRKDGDLELSYVTSGADIPQKIKQLFKEALAELFKEEIQLSFSQVPELPAGMSYKRRKVISERVGTSGMSCG